MSKSAKHTPGPWEAVATLPEEGWEAYWIRTVALTKERRLVGCAYGPQTSENAANARLIAAAPGLLAALEWFADPANWREEELSEGASYSAEWKPGFSPIDIARAAIRLVTEG